ncbi:MAG: preprotein translocase subunit SecA, partial [Candidatus Puniceispirillum sp.]
MLGSLAKNLFGNSNDRAVKRFMPQINAINALETNYEGLDDAGLKAKADELRTRVEDGADKDSLLAEAFALVREAAKRALGQRHFDVQLMGG